MRYVFVIALALALWAGPGYSNLLTNGDFEQPLDVGWQQDTDMLGGTYSFDRWDSLGQPTPGYAAHVYKALAYYAALKQTVPVPDANLAVSFDARFRINSASLSCWPVATVIVRYLDNSGVELGNTKFYSHDEYCTWANSDTAHLIDATLLVGWHSYQLDVPQEITGHLPGVNPSLVRQVMIELEAYDNGT